MVGHKGLNFPVDLQFTYDQIQHANPWHVFYGIGQAPYTQQQGPSGA